MTLLRKRIRAQEGIPTPQSCSPTTKGPELAKNYVQHHPQNVTLRSGRGPDRCYIGNQPLYFHWMTLSRVIRAQSRGNSQITKWLPDHKVDRTGGKNAHSHPQNIMIRSARGPDKCTHWQPTTLLSLNEPKWSYQGSRGNSYIIHKVPPRPQKGA